ncbi:hypothetical protein P152DRAFT_375084, partial [Eremomyces bilateralis CBS 781.70]
LYYPPIGRSFHPQTPFHNQPTRFRPRTPLIIPFTTNETFLIQTALSYIAAGWPREDIIILDNSGTMDANPREELPKDNPSHLSYQKLRKDYGISVLQTPTLLTFAQTQKFMLRLAISKEWRTFFWSRPDVVVLSDESASPYRSFYNRTVDHLLSSQNQNQKWAAKFFGIDVLVLINVDAWRGIGQWDTFLPHYNTHCDAYGRANIMGYAIENVTAGWAFTVASALDDPETVLFPP